MKKISIILLLLLQVYLFTPGIFSVTRNPVKDSNAKAALDIPRTGDHEPSGATTMALEPVRSVKVPWSTILNDVILLGEQFYAFEFIQTTLFISILMMPHKYVQYSFIVSVVAQSFSFILTLCYVAYLLKNSAVIDYGMDRDLYAYFVCPMITLWFVPLFMAFNFPSTLIARPWQILQSSLAIGAVIIVLDEVIAKKLPLRVLEVLMTFLTAYFGIGLFYHSSYITYGFKYAVMNAVIFWVASTLFTVFKTFFGGNHYDNAMANVMNVAAGLPILFMASRVVGDWKRMQTVLFKSYLFETVGHLPNLGELEAVFVVALDEFYFGKSKEGSLCLRDPQYSDLVNSLRIKLIHKCQELRGSLRTGTDEDEINDEAALYEVISELLQLLECNTEAYSRSLMGRISGF